MKKTIITILTLIFINQINSQDLKRTYIGTHIGITQSKIFKDFNEPIIKTDWKSNFSYGISYLHFYNNKLGIEAQLNYINIGTSYEDQPNDGINDNGSLNLTTDIKYINIPMTFIYSPFKSNYFNLLGGLYISKLISAKQNGNIDGYKDINLVSIDESVTNNIPEFDFGFVTGIGSKLKFTNNINLGLNFKYSFSIKDLNKNTPNDDVVYKNNFFLIDFGLEYNLD